MKTPLIGDFLERRPATTVSGIEFIVGAVVLALLAGLVSLRVISAAAGWRDGFLTPAVTDVRQVAVGDRISDTWFAPEPERPAPGVRVLQDLERAAWGTKPAGYRLVSLTLHVTAALLIWLVGVRLHVPGAFIGAVFFVVHPLSLGSIYWINRQGTLLGLPLAFGAILCFQQSLRKIPFRGLWYGGALLCTAAGLFVSPLIAAVPLAAYACIWWRRNEPERRSSSRQRSTSAAVPAPAAETTSTTPAVPAATPTTHSRARGGPLLRAARFLDDLFTWLFDPLPSKRGNRVVRDFLRGAPLLILGGAAIIVHYSWEHAHDSRTAAFAVLPDAMPGLAAAGWALMNGLVRAFAPVRLDPAGVVSMEPSVFPWPADTPSVLDWLPIVIITLILALLFWFRRQDWGRPLYLFLLLSVSLVLPTTLAMAPQTIEELVDAAQVFYILLPIVCVATAAILANFAQRQPTLQLPLLVLIVGITVGVSAVSWARAQVFRRTGTDLWQALLRSNGEQPLFLTRLGLAVAAEGHPAAALEYFERALKLNGRYAPALDGCGQIAFQKRDYYLAVAKFEAAWLANPYDANTAIRLARTCQRWGLQERNLSILKTLESEHPTAPFLYHELGMQYLKAGMFAEAGPQFDQLCALVPGDATGFACLALLNYVQGSQQTSRQFLDKALAIQPNARFPRLVQGWIQFRQNEFKQARTTFSETRQDYADCVPAVFYLFCMAARDGDKESVPELAKVLMEKVPSNPRVLTTMARVYALYAAPELQDFPKAQELAHAACEFSAYRDPLALQTLAIAYLQRKMVTPAQDALTKAKACAEAQNNFTLANTLWSQIVEISTGPYVIEPLNQPASVAETIEILSL